MATRGRPAKSLHEHVEDGSFRAREHAQLLVTSALLEQPALRAIQRRARRCQRAETLHERAVEFERAVRRARRGVDDGEEPRQAQLRALLEELGPAGSAERAIAFFPRFLKHVKGSKAGQPFELDEWQKAFLRLAFSRRRVGRVTRRVFRFIYLVVPGGNGKSPLCAGLGLLALCELEDAPEIYCLAGNKEQADTVQGFARGFVEGTEEDPGELSRWLRVRGRRILNVHTSGEMKILASSGAGLEGKDPSVVIVDELHAFERRVQEESFTALVGKLHKREDAYAIVISTAGRGSKNILLRKIKEALKFKDVTRDGCLTIAKDAKEATLLWMYQAPKDAEIDDLQVIKECNPASWIDPRIILQLLYGVGEHEFRRLARNEWVAVKNQWLPVGLWEKLARPPKQRKPPPDGAEVVLAFDGSYNNDSTALVGWVPGEDYGFVVEVWERPGDEEGWIVPRGDVKATVALAMGRWKVLELVCDPPGWYEEIEEWGRIYGDTMTLMFSTNHVQTMIEACSEFYAAVVQTAAGNGKTSHDGDPRLADHLANAFTREVGRKAYIVKEYRDSANKIDAAVAAVMARHRSLRARPAKKKRVVSWS